MFLLFCAIFSHVWILGTVYAKDISDFGKIYVQYLDPVKIIALTVDSLPFALDCFFDCVIYPVIIGLIIDSIKFPT